MVYNPYAKKRPRPPDWAPPTLDASSTSDTPYVSHQVSLSGIRTAGPANQGVQAVQHYNLQRPPTSLSHPLPSYDVHNTEQQEQRNNPCKYDARNDDAIPCNNTASSSNPTSTTINDSGCSISNNKNNNVAVKATMSSSLPVTTSSSITTTTTGTSTNITVSSPKNGMTTSFATTNVNPSLLPSVVPPLTTVGKPSPNPYLKKRVTTTTTTTTTEQSNSTITTNPSARRTVVFPPPGVVVAATTMSPKTTAATPPVAAAPVTAKEQSLTDTSANGVGQGGLVSSRPNNSSVDCTSLPTVSDKLIARAAGSSTTTGHFHRTGNSATSGPSGSAGPPRPPSWNAPTRLSTQHPMGVQASTTGIVHVDDRSTPSVVSSDVSHAHLSQHQSTDSLPEQYIDLPRELAYSPNQVQPIQDVYRMQLIKNANLQQPLKNGWTLYPHQKKAIIRSLTMRRMILALDMGLGKTIIGAIWAKAFQRTFPKLKVFVICPVSLQEEWKRTAEDKAGLPVEQTGGNPSTGRKGNQKKTGPNKLSKAKKVQGGYDTDDDVTREGVDDGEGAENGFIANEYRVKICSWSKFPTTVETYVEHFVVVCDEAHSMQSIQAARTKDVLTLTKDKRCVGLLLLTGTPMKNGKPCNLFPLLKAVRHPLGRNQKAYETHFCNGALKNFGKGSVWDASGCSNLAQLKQLVASNLLHMTKEQCLSDLPPLTNIPHHVPVSSRFQIQYERCVKDLANVQANSKSLNDEAILGAVQRLRVICAFAKVEATVELARTILNNEPAVVIFSSFAQVAKDVHAKLSASGWPCEILTGETPQTKRQQMVDNFQNGLSSVFVCTFGAGGVGLTLTAAATIILVDRPWTPGEARQAEDRIRRIGQEKNCKSYWMCSFDLDKQIDDILESKKQTTNAVLNRNGGDNVETIPTAAKISINKLVSSFLLSASRKQLYR